MDKKRRKRKSRKDGGDKAINYYRGILPFYASYGSLGMELCGLMAREWEKGVNELKMEYAAFKKAYPNLSDLERRHAWRCFAHAHKCYRRGWTPDIVKPILELMRCPEPLIEKILEYFRQKQRQAPQNPTPSRREGA